MSLPSSRGDRRAATATAPPPVEPPAVLAGVVVEQRDRVQTKCGVPLHLAEHRGARLTRSDEHDPSARARIDTPAEGEQPGLEPHERGQHGPQRSPQSNYGEWYKEGAGEHRRQAQEAGCAKAGAQHATRLTNTCMTPDLTVLAPEMS